MEVLFQTPDRYVVVVDQVEFPGESIGCGRSDLDVIFSQKTWIAVWRAADGDGLWHVTRSRRFGQPNLLQLKTRARLDRPDEWAFWECWYIYSSGEAGRQGSASDDVDPVAFAQSIYRIWEYVASFQIPRKIEHLKLDPDDFPHEAISPWLRPGIPLYLQRRYDLRELAQE